MVQVYLRFSLLEESLFIFPVSPRNLFYFGRRWGHFSDSAVKCFQQLLCSEQCCHPSTAPRSLYFKYLCDCTTLVRKSCLRNRLSVRVVHVNSEESTQCSLINVRALRCVCESNRVLARTKRVLEKNQNEVARTKRDERG